MTTDRVYNFSAGPAMLPVPVMEQVQQEFLNFNGLGASVIEISHRSKPFVQVVEEAEALFRELTGLPQSYRVLHMHGGAQMQFSCVPLNLLPLQPARKGAYLITGKWGELAEKEARRYGTTTIALSGKDEGYRTIPAWDPAQLDPESSYAHLTTNNTLYGTQWHELPDTGSIPLVGDATSEMLSRFLPWERFGVLYAGLQKNLGPSGSCLVLVRDDLLGQALPETPKLLDYQLFAAQNSMPNTLNTFAVYVFKRVLEWMKAEGGIPEMERRARARAQCLYEVLDSSSFYQAVAATADRSLMNVTFHLPSDELLQRFLQEANTAGLTALAGHRDVGGARASMYNAMPLEGAQALAAFMREFERRNG